MEVPRQGNCHWYRMEINTTAYPNHHSAEWSPKGMKKCLHSSLKSDKTVALYLVICCIIVLRLDIHVEVQRICGSALLVICCCRSMLPIWAWSSLTALNLKWPCKVLVFLCPVLQGKSHSYLVVPPCSACLPILPKARCHWQTWDPWSHTPCFPFRFQRFCHENNFVASLILMKLLRAAV